MMSTISKAIITFLLILAFSSQVFSAEDLTPESKRQVVTEVSERLTQEYVLPDVGQAMAQALMTRLESGHYDDVTSSEQFAELLTEDMVKVSNDQHLFIFYMEGDLPTEEEMMNPTPEMQEQNLRFLQYDNYAIREVSWLDGNIGYLELAAFVDAEPAKRAIGNAMDLFQHTGGLIIDLRQNGGGMPETVALLASYFLGPDSVHVDSIYWRKTDTTEEFWTSTDLDGAWYGTTRPVYILTSEATFSAAEAFSYAMQVNNRATIVGETTRGGAHPGAIARIGDHYHMFISNGRAFSAVTGENWEGTGVIPDHAESADAALNSAHKLILRDVIDQTESPMARQDREMQLQRLESE